MANLIQTQDLDLINHMLTHLEKHILSIILNSIQTNDLVHFAKLLDLYTDKFKQNQIIITNKVILMYRLDMLKLLIVKHIVYENVYMWLIKHPEFDAYGMDRVRSLIDGGQSFESVRNQSGKYFHYLQAIKTPRPRLKNDMILIPADERKYRNYLSTRKNKTMIDNLCETIIFNNMKMFHKILGSCLLMNLDVPSFEYKVRPLIFTARYGRVAMMQMLLKKSHSSATINTALYGVIFGYIVPFVSDHIDCIKLLVGAGAKIDLIKDIFRLDYYFIQAITK